MQYLFMILMFLTAVFLILLVLVQRGRGGGLTGALGGMGGQSAFGSKAGDLFTRITIGVAAFWILLCVGAIRLLNTPQDVFGSGDESVFGATSSITSEPGDEEQPAAEDESGDTGSAGLSAPPAEGDAPSSSASTESSGESSDVPSGDAAPSASESETPPEGPSDTESSTSPESE